MPIKQAAITEVDISDRLRLLMLQHKLTVADMATCGGVSKSAVEKYLAGPSSPRATAIASICMELGANAHWLLFGEADNDLAIMSNAVEGVVVALLNELRQDTELARKFEASEFGSEEWRKFTWQTGNLRAREALGRIVDARKQALESVVAGERVIQLEPHPLNTMSDEEFKAKE